MALKNFLFILMLFSLTACGFHFKQSEFTIDFSKIQPKTERYQFVNLANSLGIQHSKNSKIQVANLKIEPNLISNQNTGNKWRQYEYTASWHVKYLDNEHSVVTNESINIPSNQSPYQTQIISEQLNGLRIQLLKNTRSYLNTIN